MGKMVCRLADGMKELGKLALGRPSERTMVLRRLVPSMGLRD